MCNDILLENRLYFKTYIINPRRPVKNKRYNKNPIVEIK